MLTRYNHVHFFSLRSYIVIFEILFFNVLFYLQGGNKRPGAFAIYIEPWHADIFDVLELRKNHGKEEQRARDLFYALWIPDLVSILKRLSFR